MRWVSRLVIERDNVVEQKIVNVHGNGHIYMIGHYKNDKYWIPILKDLKRPEKNLEYCTIQKT